MKKNVFLIFSLISLGYWISKLLSTIGTKSSGVIRIYTIKDIIFIGLFIFSLYILGYLTGKEQNKNR